MVINRTNDQWKNALRSTDIKIRDTAILELHRLLLRGLSGAFKGNDCATPSLVEDSAQEALLRITANLDSFRGESKFLTWAMKIAIRIVYSEMRKAGWKDVSLDEASDVSKPRAAEIVDKSVSPEVRTLQTEIIENLWLAINESLTKKQKTALLADFVADMPIEEIARKMGTNRNAVYKLLYDARQNLRRHLNSSEISFDEVKKAFGT